MLALAWRILLSSVKESATMIHGKVKILLAWLPRIFNRVVGLHHKNVRRTKIMPWWFTYQTNQVVHLYVYSTIRLQ